MIAKQRRPAPPAARARASARGAVGIAPRRAAGGHAREIGGPGEQPVDRRREPRLALVLARAGVDARRQRDRRQRSRLARAPSSQRARSACTAGVGERERGAAARRRPAPAAVAASATPCAASHAARLVGVGPRRGDAPAAAARSSPAGGRADATPGCRYVSGGGSSSVFSSALAAAAFIASAGAMTATLARPRWLRELRPVDQRADRDRPVIASTRLDVAVVVDRRTARPARRSGCWPAAT